MFPSIGIDGIAIVFIYNSYMIAGAIAAPVKEDDVAGVRFITSLLPLLLILKPLHNIRTVGELRYNALFDITALIRTPGYIASTPSHVAIKSVQAPEFLTTLVAYLFADYLGDLCVADANVVASVWVVSKQVGYILLIPIRFPAMFPGLLIGKCRSIFYSVATISLDCPRIIAIAIVISLERKADVILNLQSKYNK